MLMRSMGVATRAAAAAALIFATGAGAQSTSTDPRLYPFLGCWAGDSAATTSRAGSLTCVVPAAATPDVELLSIVDGRVVSRRRIDAGVRPHSIDGQGCKGQERTAWSAMARRVYLRSEYVCTQTGITGGTATLFSFLPTGEWLEVEGVHSGGGTIVHVERRRDVGVPSGLPRDVAGQLSTQRLAIVTARAEAAAPIGTGDVVEALRATDTAVVRVWLGETGQHFRLGGDEVAALIDQHVPASVLQAMMSTPPKYQLGVGVDANGRSTDAYLSSPGWAPGSVVARNDYAYAYPYPSYPYYSAYAMPAYQPSNYNSIYVEPQVAYPQSYGYYSPYSYSVPAYESPYVYNYIYHDRASFPRTPVHRGFAPSNTDPVGIRPRSSSPPPVTGRRR